MDKQKIDFLERLALRNAPTFLLLGQAVLKHDTGRDAFLDSIVKKYLDSSLSERTGYSQMFNSAVKADVHAARAWISDRANLIAPPQWLEKVATFAWNGIFTSTIDGVITRAFRKDWRTIQPIYSSNLNPADPRSRSKLHVTYLYGAIEQEEDKAAPLSLFELTKREPEAVILLNRLPEQLTPLGTLVIEAYDNTSDWLTPAKLYPMLMALQKGQAFIFSASSAICDDEFLAEAVAQGNLTIFRESLSSVLTDGYDMGVIPEGESLAIGSFGHHLSTKNKTVVIPEQFWSQISRYGLILDDSFLQKKLSLSPEKRYDAFRSFLSESGVQPVWPAHLQGLPFERDFERELFNKVKENLSNRDINSDPLIVHGQTGSGKTIALANVALRIHQEKRNPVIFIARRAQRFNYAEIDGFCQWAEEQGFDSTLIVWDGMEGVEHYYSLQKYLTGRGQKFILIGSTYKLEDRESSSPNFIFARSNISEKKLPGFDKSELDRFSDYLCSFEPSLGQKLARVIRVEDPNFLVALYRLLPDTRSQVRNGLHLETGAAAVSLRENADSVKPEINHSNVLQAALQRAGLLDSQKVFPIGEQLMAGDLVSAEQEFIGLVMVPGRFGLQVPIEILLRSVSSKVVTDFSKIISGIDLFRWSEDSSNNITVGPRHSLEAKLISQMRLGGAQHEVEYAIKLLRHIRRSEDSFDSNEIQFASEFIKSLGPNGPEGQYYVRQYIELADALSQIREENGIRSPRLMLQEASLLREATVLNLIDQHDFTSRTQVLSRASKVLDEAIREAGTSGRQTRLKTMLYVELASTHGAIAREYIRAGKEVDDIIDEFTRAKAAAMIARQLMPEDFFAIDVIAWSTKDLLTHAELPFETRIEIIADTFNTFAMVEGGEMNRRDEELLEKRRTEFAGLLQDEKLLKDSLARLEEMGSTAGYYLKAVMLAGSLPPATGVIDDHVQSRCAVAATYLYENFDKVKTDSKCLYLYLRYWWSATARLPFYPDERTAIPLNPEQWRHLIETLGDLIALDGNYENPHILYMQAVANWHLAYYDIANGIWRDLQQISDRVTGKKRIMKTYLASSENGLPIKFNGIVGSVSEDGSKGEVFVERLRLRIPFFPRDFGREDIRRDEELSGFHIAFNYIAPTADPARHYKDGQGARQ